MKPKWLIDANKKRIETLDYRIRPYAYEFVALCEKYGVDILITEGIRNIDRQAKLYAKGRSESGAIVTNAKPGWSFHNYGFALDFCPIVNRKCAWTRYDLFRTCGELAQTLGFEWGALKKHGGDFNIINDMPHIQMRFGLTIRDFIAGKRPIEQLDDQEEFVFALERLRSLGIMKSPDYWLQNAIPEKTVKGEYVRSLILSATNYINLNLN